MVYLPSLLAENSLICFLVFLVCCSLRSTCVLFYLLLPTIYLFGLSVLVAVYVGLCVWFPFDPPLFMRPLLFGLAKTTYSKNL